MERKEAIEVIKKNYPDSSLTMLREALETLIPELKESEDEKIRKWLISQLKIKLDVTNSDLNIMIDKAISWLKKQGEQMFADGTFVNVDDVREDFVQEVYRVLDADSTNDRANQIIDAFDNLPTVTIEEQGEQKQTVIIPRFRVGDVITSTKNSALKYKIKAVGVLNELGEYDYVVEDVTDTDYKGHIHKMSISKVDEWGVVVEQKPAWSEEDENILDAITYTVKNSGYKHCIGVSNEMMITFIKSLKDRVLPKQE